jgi:hypothetical protein
MKPDKIVCLRHILNAIAKVKAEWRSRSLVSTIRIRFEGKTRAHKLTRTHADLACDLVGRAFATSAGAAPAVAAKARQIRVHQCLSAGHYFSDTIRSVDTKFGGEDTR